MTVRLPKVEAAQVAQLSPSQSVVVERRGVRLLRGDRTWFVNDSEMDKLVALWASRSALVEP
jgi:hypothetical protein